MRGSGLIAARGAAAFCRSTRLFCEAQAHDFDARVLVLDGSITFIFGTDRATCRAGDSFSLPAGTTHEEHTEADGARLVEEYRAPMLAPAAK